MFEPGEWDDNTEEGRREAERVLRQDLREAQDTASKAKFADLPSAGIWANRTESDEELLEKLGSGWRGFGTE